MGKTAELSPVPRDRSDNNNDPPRHERGVRLAPGHSGWEPPEPVHLGGQGDSAARGRRP